MTPDQVKSIALEVMNSQGSPFSTAKVPYHTHNKVDSLGVNYRDLLNIPNVTIYIGTVFSAGGPGPIFPTGWTVSAVSANTYKIIHNLNTTNYLVYAVVALNNGLSTNSFYSFSALAINTNTPNPDYFEVVTGYNNSGSPTPSAAPFNFIVGVFK